MGNEFFSNWQYTNINFTIAQRTQDARNTVAPYEVNI